VGRLPQIYIADLAREPCPERIERSVLAPPDISVAALISEIADPALVKSNHFSYERSRRSAVLCPSRPAAGIVVRRHSMVG
jgi:hypothetical protein